MAWGRLGALRSDHRGGIGRSWAIWGDSTVPQTFSTIADVNREINRQAAALRAARCEIQRRYQDTFAQEDPGRIRIATDIELREAQIESLYRRKRELAAAVEWHRPTAPAATRAPKRDTDWIARALAFRKSMRLDPSQFQQRTKQSA